MRGSDLWPSDTGDLLIRLAAIADLRLSEPLTLIVLCYSVIDLQFLHFGETLGNVNSRGPC
jgi:hypothetical protein